MFSAYIDDGYAIESKRSLTASLGESDFATGTATSCLQTLESRTASPSRHEVREDRQWRNHARAITGSARVGFISARAVVRPENELGVLCLSITNQDVFRFKTAV